MALYPELPAEGPAVMCLCSCRLVVNDLGSQGTVVPTVGWGIDALSPLVCLQC